KGKANDGFLVGYAAHSKAYRVYNLSRKKVEETLNMRYLEDKPNVQGLGQEWYFDLDYLSDSLSYTRFKTNPPAGTHDTNIIAGTHDTNIIAGTQDDDSESEYDEQVILNNLDYAKELAMLQRQEHEAHSTAANIPAGSVPASHVYAGSVPASHVSTSSVPASHVPAGSVPASHVHAGSVPASHVSTGSVPASHVPAGSVPASHVPASSIHVGGVLAGSINSASFGDPAASESVPTIFTIDHAATSLLPHEPSSVAKALADPDWVAAMQEEMQQFYNQQVYVDDIIFGSTNQAWCDEFEVLMKGEFEMSAMGELTFFLGLQVKQLPDGIFISQDKYVKDMLKKFDMESVRTATTPYEVPKHKSKDEPNDAVNVYMYRSMIGSLMYLTASRPDIMFALEAYSDSDYAGSHGDRKSTTATSSTEAEYVVAASCCGQVYVYILTHSCRLYLVYCRMTAVSCGFLLYAIQIVGMPLILLVVPVFLPVALVPADGGDLTMAEQLVGFIKAALLNVQSAV
nr:copia protein [Tanacetum cinerariifolium]